LINLAYSDDVLHLLFIWVMHFETFQD